MTWDTKGSKVGKSNFQALYPCGGYIEQPYTREFTQQELNEVDQIITEGAENGMNTFYLRVSSTSASCEFIINRLKELGCEAVVEPNDANGEQAIIDKYGSNVIAAFLNQDDQERKSLTQCRDRYDYLKQNFPEIPVYSTGEMVDQAAREKRAVADIVAQQNYQSGRYPTISKIVSLYTGGRIDGNPFLANPQSFIGYEGVFPDPEEMYCYGLLAVIFCDGLIWYTLFNPEMSHSILNYSEHWELLKQLSREISLYELELTAGQKQVAIDGEKVTCTVAGSLTITVELQNNPRIIGSFQA